MSTLKFSAHVGYLFQELGWRDRLEAASRWGFVAAEHPAPYPIAASTLATWLRETGLGFAQIALPADPQDPSGKGMAIFGDRRARFRESVQIGLDYAAEVGCPRVHVMAGVRPDGADDEALWDSYLEALAYAAESAAPHGIGVLVENIGSGTIADYFIDTVDKAREAIEAVGTQNLRLLVDVFHAASAGEDCADLVRRHADLIGHIQIADFPGRHEPGTGGIDFGSIFTALIDAQYSGLVGCEYIPLGASEDGLSWMAARERSG